MSAARSSPAQRGWSRRLVVAYVLLVGLPLAAAVVLLSTGGGSQAPPIVEGTYRVGGAAACTGGALKLTQSGEFVDAGDAASGRLRLRDGRLTGTLRCADGSEQALSLAVSGGAGDRVQLAGTIGPGTVTAEGTAQRPEAAPPTGSHSTLGNEELFGRLMLAIAVVIVVARLFGTALRRLGQPQVMGEVLAGIALGPTLLGTVWGAGSDFFFPPQVIAVLQGAADIGLAFYMFLVGLELDPAVLRGRIAQAALISNTSVAIPLLLGIAAAVPLFSLLGIAPPFVAFGLFMGVAMAITAFPVLARILIERRMLKHPVGAMALATAAIDDVCAWGLLALAVASSGKGSALDAIRIIALISLFCAAMGLVGRPLLTRVSRAYDEAGRVPLGWIVSIFLGVLLSAFLSEQIGISAIFGAFVMGLIMPRRADLTHDISSRMEDFVVTVLLPLFFVVTGLRTNVLQLNRAELLVIGLGLLLIAVVSKWGGTFISARIVGYSSRDASAMGALRNTRGLTELIVLNIGRERGVISPALFTLLVLMAIVTTLMTGPALRLIDRRSELSSPPEEELRQAPRSVSAEHPVAPERAILVASEDAKNFAALMSLAEPLTRTAPPRELILARLVLPSRRATGLAGDDRDLQDATAELARMRDGGLGRGLTTRAVAFTSTDPGADIVRLSRAEEIDLVLLDGRRPLLGGGILRGDVGAVLSGSPADVGVLITPDGQPASLGPQHPVVVPFGGAEHDWGALELGAWIASTHASPLRLLGARASLEHGRRDASRLLADASLVVQQFAGVSAEPVLADPGKAGILAAARGAGMVVVGVSDRWRHEGLGELRSEIARDAQAPTLFVRRGTRPGALAPRGAASTRFSWSMVAPPPGGQSEQPGPPAGPAATPTG